MAVDEQGVFERFQASIDPTWVEAALEATETASLRRRRLPAETVFWLVIGMALFRNWAISDVVRHLGLARPEGRKKNPAISSIVEARANLGPSPLRWLFQKIGAVWGHASAAHRRWRGFALYAVDSTVQTVPDSVENREKFGKHRSQHGESGYPLLRCTTLMAVRSRLLVGAELGSFRTDERTMAKALWPLLPSGSLVLFDSNFFAADVLFNLAQTGRHWLTRARKSLKWEVTQELGHGHSLVQMTTSRDARRRCPELPRTWVARVIQYQRPGYKTEFLITSLLDHKQYPAPELVELYHERWEIELGYGEMKTVMLQREETIRSRKPAGVEQEMWGLAIAYNLVRREMELAAELARLPPNRLSFTQCYETIRANLIILADTSPGVIPKRLDGLRHTLSNLVLPPRRSDRYYERKMKLAKGRFPSLNKPRLRKPA